mmetsp:Transcript_19544/g.38690  ORF Transcript_19544/g.38690 Transcript_19544/m.38690 type:complete len:264 (-) Transcript_19544:6021-6812(-)
MDRAAALCMAVNARKVSLAPTAPRKSVQSPRPTTLCAVVTVTVSTACVHANKAGLEKHVMPNPAPTTVRSMAFAWKTALASANPNFKESTAPSSTVLSLCQRQVQNTVPKIAVGSAFVPTASACAPKARSTVLPAIFSTARMIAPNVAPATLQLGNVSALMAGQVPTVSRCGAFLVTATITESALEIASANTLSVSASTHSLAHPVKTSFATARVLIMAVASTTRASANLSTPVPTARSRSAPTTVHLMGLAPSTRLSSTGAR